MHDETEHRATEPSGRFLVGAPFGFPKLAFPEWGPGTLAVGPSATKKRPSPLVWAEVGMVTSVRPPARHGQRKAAVADLEYRAKSPS